VIYIVASKLTLPYKLAGSGSASPGTATRRKDERRVLVVFHSTHKKGIRQAWRLLRASSCVVDYRRKGTAMPRTRTDELTHRQEEVAELIRQGMTNREIAERLDLSRRTVEDHVSNIKDKWGVDNRVEIATRVGDSREEETPP
jgi:DNA-binding NarL/FixJ family response regulator